MDDETLDLIGDLTEEELQALNNDLDEEFKKCTGIKQHPSRIQETKEKVYTLEEIIKRNKIHDLPPPRKQTIKTTPSAERTWKTSTSHRPSKDVKSKDVNNNEIRRRSEDTIHAGEKDEDDLLLEGLTDEELLELAALTEAHSLLTQDQSHSACSYVLERRFVLDKDGGNYM